MGQGGHLLLKNKTPYRWRKTAQHSYQMKSWDNSFPEIIDPGTFAHVYIEWTEGTKVKKDDAGEIDYVMEGANVSFQVQARAKNGFEIRVQCRGFSTSQIPPGGTVSLGWAHDGTIFFMIAGTKDRFTSLGSRQHASKWMQHIDDDKKLSELSIPGTHDTCTYDMSLVNLGYLVTLIYIVPTADPLSLLLKGGATLLGPIAVNRVAAFTRCQDMDIARQLDAGIRFLDIRLKMEGGRLQAYHGFIKIPLTFSQIMGSCYRFLDANPSETVLMSIKNEGDGDKPIDGLVQQEIDAHAARWYTETAIPKLGNGRGDGGCRGKVVLFRRYATAHALRGIDVGSIWPDNTQQEGLKNNDGQLFSIQDEYKNYVLSELDHKFINHVRPYLKTVPGTQFINFTSGMGSTGGFVFPKTLAKGEESFSTFRGTNYLLYRYLLDKVTATYGIIAMDFPEYPGESLIPMIISTNNFR